MAVEIQTNEVPQPVTATVRGITVTTSGGTVEELSDAIADHAGSLLPEITAPAAAEEPPATVEEPPSAAAPAVEPPAKETHGEMRKRIAKQAADKKEIEAERDRLKAENDRLKAAPPSAPILQPGTPVLFENPSPEGFPAYETWAAQNPGRSYEQYWDARTDFRWQQKEQARQIEQRQAQLRAEWTEKQARFTTQQQELPDWSEVVDPDAALFTPVMYDAIMDSPLSAKLIYTLAKNPADAQRIAQLPPGAQIREVGILEGTLRATSPGTAARPLTSRAPRPIQPGGGSATPASSESFVESAARIGSQTRGTMRQYEQLRASHGITGRRR